MKISLDLQFQVVLSGPEFEKWKFVQLFDERYLEFQSWRLIKGNKGSGGWDSCVAKSGDAFTERSRVIGRRTIERSGTEYTLSRCVGNSLEYHAVFNFYDPRVESGFHKEGRGFLSPCGKEETRARNPVCYPFNHVPRVCPLKLNRMEKRRITRNRDTQQAGRDVVKNSNWKTVETMKTKWRGHLACLRCFAESFRDISSS